MSPDLKIVISPKDTKEVRQPLASPNDDERRDESEKDTKKIEKVPFKGLPKR